MKKFGLNFVENSLSCHIVALTWTATLRASLWTPRSIKIRAKTDRALMQGARVGCIYHEVFAIAAGTFEEMERE